MSWGSKSNTTFREWGKKYKMKYSLLVFWHRFTSFCLRISVKFIYTNEWHVCHYICGAIQKKYDRTKHVIHFIDPFFKLFKYECENRMKGKNAIEEIPTDEKDETKWIWKKEEETITNKRSNVSYEELCQNQYTLIHIDNLNGAFGGTPKDLLFYTDAIHVLVFGSLLGWWLVWKKVNEMWKVKKFICPRIE